MSESAVIESTQPTPATSGDALRSMSDDQRSHWLKTGEPPTSEPANPAATDPEPVSPDPALDATTEPVAQPTKTGKPRTDVNARIGQMAEQKRLATERAEKAERELAELRAGQAPQPTTPPNTAPAPPVQTPEAPPTYLDLVKRYQTDPAWPTFEAATAAGFDDPYGATVAAQAAFIQQRQTVEREQQTAFTAARTREQQNIDKAFADARQMEGFKENALDIPITPTFAKTIFESDLSGQLLYYFSEHPAEGRAIAAMEPLAAARAIGKIEAGLATSSPVVTSTPAASKTVSSAPAPTTTLGARHTPGPTDEVDDAVRAGDTGRFIEAANRRDFAALKGGRR